MPEIIKFPYTPYRKQWEFIQLKYRYNFYSGAYRGGKTLALVVKAVDKLTTVPGAIIFLGCHTHPMLKRVIYPYLFTMMNAYPKKYWDFNASDKKLTFYFNKQVTSVMWLGHLQNENAVAGMGLTDYFLDEGTRGINAATFKQLNSRISQKGAQANIAANPDAITHFLYEHFFVDKAKPNRSTIQAKTKHNPFLPTDYLDDLDGMPEEWKARYMDGEWGYTEGAVYKEFSHNDHVYDFEKVERYPSGVEDEIEDQETQSGWEYFITIDWGWNSPAAVLLVGKDRDSNFFVIDEIYRKEMLITDLAARIQERFLDHYRIEGVYYDVAAPYYIAELQQRIKITKKAVRGQKAVAPGILSVRKKLQLKPDGYPSLVIHPRCKNLIKEFQSYKWKQDRDEVLLEVPMSKDDHALDALRYLIHAVSPMVSQTVYF